MSRADEYLWDKSGAPDPEIAALERVLGVLAEPPEAPARAAPAPKAEARPSTGGRQVAYVAVAATLAAVLATLAYVSRRPSPTRAEAEPAPLAPVQPEPPPTSAAGRALPDESTGARDGGAITRRSPPSTPPSGSVKDPFAHAPPPAPAATGAPKDPFGRPGAPSAAPPRAPAKEPKHR
jgi:hypothetical protein